MPCPARWGYQTLTTRGKQAGHHIIYTEHVLAITSVSECIGVAMVVVGEDGNRDMSRSQYASNTGALRMTA
jgi:hypothetical protein